MKNAMDQEKLDSRSAHTIVKDYYFQDNYSVKCYSTERNDKDDFINNNIILSIESSDSSNSFISNRSKKAKRGYLRDDNFKASIFMFLSHSLYSIVNLIGKFIGFYYPEVENAITNLIRGIVLMALSVIYLKKKKVDFIKELDKPVKKLIILVIRCFFGAACNLIIFESFKYMRISSSFTIFNISPLFVSILAVIFLNGKITKLDIISFALCFISVCLIAKPFAFMRDSVDNEDTPFGVFLSLIAAVLSAIAIFSNRVISKDFHYIITIFGMGLCFFLQSAALIPFSKSGFSTINFNSFILAIILSTIFYYSFGFFVQAMNIGDPIKILPITYVSIVLNQFYNSFVFGQHTDYYDIIGMVTIITINILRTVKQRG